MRATLALVLVSLCTAGTATAQPGKRTYANPIDLDYRYNYEQVNEDISYRTGADPVIIRHKGAYYLFQTLAEGLDLDGQKLAAECFVRLGFVADVVVGIVQDAAFSSRP